MGSVDGTSFDNAGIFLPATPNLPPLRSKTPKSMKESRMRWKKRGKNERDKVLLSVIITRRRIEKLMSAPRHRLMAGKI